MMSFVSAQGDAEAVQTLDRSILATSGKDVRGRLLLYNDLD